ncbi:MAG: DUF1566 domain-containing protein [Spirochaetes bacterium]|nr:DUF1566 domain-containing protein [Spirochaetota bacterium]
MKIYRNIFFNFVLLTLSLMACAKSDGGSSDSGSGSGGSGGGGGSTPAAPTFTDNLNGTIAASATTTTNGLTWMKCSQGQTYNIGPNTCTGTPLTNILYCSANDQSCNNSSTYLLNGTGTSAAYTSCNNLNSTPPGGFAGKTTWRVPTKEELRSLVVCSNGPATPVADNTTCTAGSTNPAMNTSVFPANSSVSGKAHWSATTDSAFVANAFTTTFTCLAACLGSTGAGNNKATGLSLRCVAD